MNNYRPEIDGLRAIAVMAVILYHAKLLIFSGGYIGVDVFLVISGYLISSIIFKDLDNGDFSLKKFYQRRARRIMPALFLITVCCVPISLLLMPPKELIDFSWSIVSVVLSYSNFFFWKSNGYFETVTELKPLAHIWSLSLEEQFYIIYPIITLILWRSRKYLIVSIIIVGSISLFLTRYGIDYRNANFYSPFTRAWELIAGVIVALIERDRVLGYGRTIDNIFCAWA